MTAACHTIGPHRLFLGDAYAIRPTLGWFDADVMDPPYLFDNSGGGAFRKSRGAADQIVAEALDQGFDHTIINPLLTGAVAGLIAEFGWARAALRFSGQAGPWQAARTIEAGERDRAAIVCPAQTGATECCATCALCWNSQRSIGFGRH
jgi:hypothetical protein